MYYYVLLLLLFTLWYMSWRFCWAPSEPDPIALASYSIKVPLGSKWYKCGPVSSTPANKRATPKGRLFKNKQIEFKKLIIIEYVYI